MWSRRVERINELLLQEISRRVAERQDPDIGFVTFTGVKITEDLMEAKVYYSVLGSDADRERTAAALHRYKHELRRSLRRLESLRRIPDFHFIYDGTPARAARVNELLEVIHRESGSGPAVPPAEASEILPAPSGAADGADETDPLDPETNGRRPSRKRTR